MSGRVGGRSHQVLLSLRTTADTHSPPLPWAMGPTFCVGFFQCPLSIWVFFCLSVSSGWQGDGGRDSLCASVYVCDLYLPEQQEPAHRQAECLFSSPHQGHGVGNTATSLQKGTERACHHLALRLPSPCGSPVHFLETPSRKHLARALDEFPGPDTPLGLPSCSLPPRRSLGLGGTLPGLHPS